MYLAPEQMARGDDRKQLNVLLPRDLVREFKAHVALHETTIQDEMARMIKEACGRHE